jgi:putative endonuclease
LAAFFLKKINTTAAAMFFTYILYSKSKDRYYIGQTNNLEKRLTRHNNKEVRSTKYGVPWLIVYHQAFDIRLEAMKHERYLKSLKNRVALQKIIGAMD